MGEKHPNGSIAWGKSKHRKCIGFFLCIKVGAVSIFSWNRTIDFESKSHTVLGLERRDFMFKIREETAEALLLPIAHAPVRKRDGQIVLP